MSKKVEHEIREMTEKKKGTNDWGVIQKKNKTTGGLEWYARIVKVDGTGKRKQYTKKAKNKAEAKRFRNELASQFDKNGEAGIEGNKLLFRDLCDIYQKRKLQEAEYVGEGRARRKVRGKRSLAPSLGYLTLLKEHFGARLVKDISHDDIEDFKQLRLATPTKRGARSVVDVNRSLEHLRAVLRFATRQGWITRTPFEAGTSLISKAEENKRERTLSPEEEAKLLAACGKRRTHLRPIIVTALDTAMRRGELFKLKWNDVNIERGVITILATNTKVERERHVGMTSRVKEELRKLWVKSDQKPDSLVFGVKDTIKTGFAAACKEAGIEDLHFHDFRHTAITRFIARGVSPVVVQKISGHSQYSTFQGYVNPDKDTVVDAAAELSKFNEENDRKALEATTLSMPPGLENVVEIAPGAAM